MAFQHDVHSQPPQLAMWLLLLFTPVEQTESILGDLLEEFSGFVITSGLGFARRWYWRQTLNSIQHGWTAAFRASPLLMLVAVVGGLWFIGFATTLSQHATRTFLDAHGIYRSLPDAYLFWSRFPLHVGRVIICALVGSAIALVVKRREMQVVTAVCLAQILMFCVAVLAVIARGEEWFQWFVVMAKWNGLGYIATVAGGLIVKLCRCWTIKAISPA